MDDILAKVQEILDDPQKLEGFKNLASSLINGGDKMQSISQDKSNENLDDKKLNNENQLQQNEGNNNFDVEGILNNLIQNKNGEHIHANKDQIEIPFNIDMILKLKNAMSIMNQDDKNIAFLRALRDLLDDDKQQKVDNAIKIMRIVKLLPLIKDLNILKNFKII